MINVYHRAEHDCIVVEEESPEDRIFIHVHKTSGSMALRELTVFSPEGELFNYHIDYEEECDQSRRR